MNLVTFGCSLTTGFGLDDNPEGKIASKYSWPALLADQLGCKVDNRAVSGASNKEILWHLQNYNFQPSDIVVILWSHKDRWCLLHGDHIQPVNFWLRDEASLAYFDHCHSDTDMLIDMHTRIQHAHLYLNNKGITNFHAYADRKPYATDYSWFNVPMLDVDMGYIRNNNPKAMDDRHPGPLAHSKFANKVYDEIQKI